MIGILLAVVGLATVATVSNAECANACNGHGKCSAYDMCICNRNWQAADCSERVCMFGLAHVDTPKGDLNMDGTVQSPNLLLIDNNYVYPFGTTEQFPQMQDSDLQTMDNTAHYYMECSNKGTCDRTTGECQCYDGYDGVACQRASCPGYPNSCSGHGVCKTIEQLASEDSGNVYKLWDRSSTMGCSCDPGYSGPDCSLRECKYGVDPLFLDDVSTIKYSIWDLATLTTKKYLNAITDNGVFTDGQTERNNGQWAIRFYDNHGEDWVTEPIPGGATCNDVINALYNLPNDVIPASSLRCTRTSVLNGTENEFSYKKFTYDTDNPFGSAHPYKLIYKLALWEGKQPLNQGEISDYTPIEVYTGSNDTSRVQISGFIYRLKFFGSPGKLKSPEIEIYLDGKRPSLVTPGGKVITKVWTDGQQGEDYDYFADHCDGVTVRIDHHVGTKTRVSFLTGMTVAERNLLKKCLGDSDFDTSNNVDVYNWDYGSKLYPHIIKLVRTVTSHTDGGYYAVVWFDPTSTYRDSSNTAGTFKLLNPFDSPDTFSTDNYDVYTTKGTLALTSNGSEATFGFASNVIYTTNVTYDTYGLSINSTAYDGDISCETGNNNAAKFEYIFHCLNKSDLFTLLNWELPSYNPPYINLYRAERVHTGPYQYSVRDRFRTTKSSGENLPVRGGSREMHYMTHYINTDISTNWAASVGNFTLANEDDDFGQPQFHVYKFFPAPASTYQYVAPCSNRGICDTTLGTCDCFPGYTNDNCDTQSSLAV